MEIIITKKLIEEYAEYLRMEEKSKNTIDKYVRDIKALYVFIGEKPVSKELALDYKEHLLEANYAVSSINSIIASMNSFFIFIGLEHIKIKVIKEQKQIFCSEEKELTKAEYTRLVNAAAQDLQKIYSDYLKNYSRADARLSPTSTLESCLVNDDNKTIRLTCSGGFSEQFFTEEAVNSISCDGADAHDCLEGVRAHTKMRHRAEEFHAVALCLHRIICGGSALKQDFHCLHLKRLLCVRSFDDGARRDNGRTDVELRHIVKTQCFVAGFFCCRFLRCYITGLQITGIDDLKSIEAGSVADRQESYVLRIAIAADPAAYRDFLARIALNILIYAAKFRKFYVHYLFPSRFLLVSLCGSDAVPKCNAGNLRLWRCSGGICSNPLSVGSR